MDNSLTGVLEMIKIGLTTLFTNLYKKLKNIIAKGLFQNPFFSFFSREKSAFFSAKNYRPKSGNFYFGLVAFALLGVLCVSSNSFAEGNSAGGAVTFNSFFKGTDNSANTDLFFSQNNASPLQTPDLKIIQDNTLAAVSTPSILNTQTLGDVFGGTSGETRKAVVDYQVQVGDTVDSVAANFGLLAKTIRDANHLSAGAPLKAGETLTILPVDGVIHVVKSGDTISQIAKTYKASADDIIAFNSLAGEGDVFIGDILIIPGGVLPARSASGGKSAAGAGIEQIALPNSSLIYPLLNFRITQGLHFRNAVDLQPLSGCGTPVYASAAGIVQRAVGNGGWNMGMGNHVSILHATLGDVVTYYGHLMQVFVKPGDLVYQGQEIGLVGGKPGMPGAGDSTGCHVHWDIGEARNPLAGHPVGEVINVNK